LLAISSSKRPEAAAAAMSTGRLASGQRSARVITNATDPSVSWQQSKRRTAGSAIQRDAW